MPANPAFTRATLQTQNQVGLYLQDQIRLGGWSLTVGGRQDWADSNTRDRIDDTSTSLHDSAFTWRAALLYRFDFGLAPYFSYTTSFQPTSGVSFSGAPFKPTEGKQYELGLKYRRRASMRCSWPRCSISRRRTP